MGPKTKQAKATAHAHEEAAAVWVERTALHAWDKNPRKNEKAVPKVVESIKRFGFASPIIARKNGEVIAGHTRLLAAEALGMDRVPVRYMDLDPAEAHLLALADNRLNEVAEWDKPVLQEIMSEYGLEAIDVAGWSSRDIDMMGHELMRDAEVEDTEQPTDADTQKRAKPGDVWFCGRHIVVCGSSEDKSVWAHCHDGPRLVVTDPPYGVEYDADWRNELGFGASAVGVVENDDRADWSNVFELASGDVVYSWCASTQVGTILGHMGAYDLRALIIWNKSKMVISRGHYHYKHEPCLYFVRRGATAKWCGDRSQTTVWDIPNPKIDNAHSTSKPIECMAAPIRNHGFDLVVDPFLGSGTTLLASEQLGRSCFGVEINPAYVDIALSRWEKLTGQSAKLKA